MQMDDSHRVQLRSVRLDMEDEDERTSKSSINSYEYCLAFQSGKENQLTKVSRKILESVIETGLDVYVHRPQTPGNVCDFALVRAKSLDSLKAYAEAIGFRMKVDPIALKKRFMALNIAINEDTKYSHLSPYEDIFIKYDRRLDDLFVREPGSDHAFDHITRVKVIEQMMLRGNSMKKSHQLNVEYLRKHGFIQACFPLQDAHLHQSLAAQWLSVWGTTAWGCPTHLISDYFGEKIGLYFEFIGHMSRWLLVPAIVGMAFQLVVLIKEDFNYGVIPFYSVLVAAWSMVVLQYWKRRETTFSMRRGTQNFEEEEPDRAGFRGPRIVSYVDGSDMRYFSNKRYKLHKLAASIAITLCGLAVLACVAGVYYVKQLLLETSYSESAQAVVSAINAVMIIVFSALYSKIAYSLNEFENHRTETAYEDHLVSKMYGFQFINSYSSFFYLAFIAQYLDPPAGSAPFVRGQCAYASCMTPLAINLAVIFGTRLFITNSLRVLGAWCSRLLKSVRSRFTVTPQDDQLPSATEVEFKKPEWDHVCRSIENYTDLAIQFGHLTFFSAALPCTCAFAFVCSLFEIRLDAFDLMYKHQRPALVEAEDIGTWYDVLRLSSVICVVTNAALVVFTMNNLDNYTIGGKIWIFIGFQWTMFCIQFVLAKLIPDIPDYVSIQNGRSTFIQAHLSSQLTSDGSARSPSSWPARPMSTAVSSPDMFATPVSSKSTRFMEENKEERSSTQLALHSRPPITV